MIGAPEAVIIVIALAAIFLFGHEPAIKWGKTLGAFLKEFRKASEGKTEEKIEEQAKAKK